MLSTTAHALRLTEPVTTIPYPTQAHHWSEAYLRQVAGHSDQVALMAYDSGLILPTDYRSWVAYQVRRSVAALRGTDIDFMIGVPASEEWTLSHHVVAETTANALYGIGTGLSETDAPDVIDGIAVYPFWETDEGEWELLQGAPHMTRP